MLIMLRFCVDLNMINKSNKHLQFDFQMYRLIFIFFGMNSLFLAIQMCQFISCYWR